MFMRKHRISSASSFFLAFVSGLFLFSCNSPENSGLKKIPSNAEKDALPEFLVFAGDTIPLKEPEIRERLEKELLINRYWQSNTEQWIRRSVRWFPLIDSILKQNGLPPDFRYLVAIESGFENVVSPRGASGFWQLMEGTAREFGLLISPEIDERLDPEKSGAAASKLLKRGYSEFKNWTGAAIAYNVGIHGLKSVMQAQYSDSYFDLLINQESSRYLFRILSAKLILENPEKYGFAVPEKLPFYQSKNQELTENIKDLPWWCRKNGFSYKCFRLLNPWVRTASLSIPEGRSSLTVKIPLNCLQFTGMPLPPEPARDSLAMQNRVTEENLVAGKNMEGFRQRQLQPEAAEKFHLVQPGESISSIAGRYRIRSAEVFRLNPDLKGRPDLLHEGVKIRISP